MGPRTIVKGCAIINTEHVPGAVQWQMVDMHSMRVNVCVRRTLIWQGEGGGQGHMKIATLGPDEGRVDLRKSIPNFHSFFPSAHLV